MFFKFLFIHKTFFARVCFFNDVRYLVKLRQRKVTTRTTWRKFYAVLFCVILEVSFYGKGSKPRLYPQKQPPEVFCKKKVFLKISQNSPENTCARVYFFNKVVGLRLKKRCFPVNFAKFLRTHFLIEHLWTTASLSRLG